MTFGTDGGYGASLPKLLIPALAAIAVLILLKQLRRNTEEVEEEMEGYEGDFQVLGIS